MHALRHADTLHWKNTTDMKSFSDVCRFFTMPQRHACGFVRALASADRVDRRPTVGKKYTSPYTAAVEINYFYFYSFTF